MENNTIMNRVEAKSPAGWGCRSWSHTQPHTLILPSQPTLTAPPSNVVKSLIFFPSCPPPSLPFLRRATTSEASHKDEM